MSKDKRPMKPWRGWAMVKDGQIVTIYKAPSVYGTKRDVLLDKEAKDYAVRVEIRKIKG